MKEIIKLEVSVRITHEGTVKSRKQAIKDARECVCSVSIGGFGESAKPIRARLLEK